MRDAAGEVVVMTTCERAEQAAALARSVVEKRLAACVTCLPGATSYFRWQSETVSEEREVLLLIKTRRDKLAELESIFEQEHPYDVPEFVVVEMAGLSAGYGTWLHAVLEHNTQGDA